MNKRFLLIGNPNVGKTTVFNNLTGLSERVSNFEGVTVSKKEGIIKSTKDTVIDLPGLNNLNDNTLISSLVSKELIMTSYDSILYVVDTTYIKKSLYMLIDILESKKEVKLLLNMSDIFKGNIDINLLEEKLSLHAYEVDKKNSLDFTNIKSKANSFTLTYDELIENLIKKVLKYKNDIKTSVDNRYLALQLIKGSQEVIDYFDNLDKLEKIIKDFEQKIIDSNKAKSISGLIFSNKRDFINTLLKEVYKNDESTVNKVTKIIDKIALHKVFGYVLFAFVMWLVFLVSFQFSFLGDYIDILLQTIITMINNFLVDINSPDIVISFIVNGFLAGIASILVFLPQIIILFALITLLEGSGYFTRVSILFGNFFNKIGLSAHSLIPLISGLGCNVLSIMATRSIKVEKNRIATIFASPYISCSARFPVYIIFIEVFFNEHKALILLSLYLLGIVVALLVAMFIDKVIYKDQKEEEVNIVQLTSYRLLDFKYFLKIVFKKVINFIEKAGFLVVIGTIIMWLLLHLGFNGYTTNITESFLYLISSGLATVFSPLGFGSVEASSSLMAAFFAKELAVSSMVVSYGATTPDQLNQIISQEFTVASAYSFMVFTLLYIPCLATLGAIYSETKKISFVLYSVILSLILGYFCSLIIYNIINVFS